VPPGATVIQTDAEYEGVTLIIGRAFAVRGICSGERA
jgi:hypothetical protein